MSIDAAFDGPDLVVAGAGGGLVGALRAAELGRSVLVVERNEHFAAGNNTSMSTAMIPGPGSRLQQAAGVDDSPETFVADVMAKTHDEADPRLTAALAAVGAPLVEWMIDHLGIPLSLVTDFSYPGHSVNRCHSIEGRSGQTLLQYLVRSARAEPLIDFMIPARLESLRVADGRLEAVEVVGAHGEREEIPTRAVLLATNGFAADPALVGEYIPEISGAIYHGSEGSTGDALRMGAELGAATAFLDSYQGHAALAMPAAGLAGWATVMHGGFLVDRHGRRFGDETTGYSEYAAHVLAHADGGEAWIIIDRRIHDLCLSFEDYRGVVSSGGVRWADTVGELAAVMGAEPEVLAGTLDEAGNGEPDRFGRTFWSTEPLSAPWGAIKVKPALFHTQGGLVVDENARVLRPDGSVAATGVYAAGGAANGISGHGAGGYLAGNGLLSAFGLSFLAASHL